MKTIVYQNESDVEVTNESPRSTKREIKSDTRSKKQGDLKQETDRSSATDEVKQPTYQWKSITADGQIYIQNSTTQEYEKVDQLRLILETNPKTNEVV